MNKQTLYWIIGILIALALLGVYSLLSGNGGASSTISSPPPLPS